MQTACLNLKCPGLLIYRGSHYECVYCHTRYPAAQIHALAAIPLDTLDEDIDRRDLAAIYRDMDRQMYQQIDAEDRGEFIEDWPEDV